MVDASSPRAPRHAPGWLTTLRLLSRDTGATLAALYLLLLVVTTLSAPAFLGGAATGVDLDMRNAPPLASWDPLYVLGADSLGRSMLARLLVASANTLLIAVSAVLLAMGVGVLLGLFAGYVGGWLETLVMRSADIIMSFPSLLLAVVVLYVLEPGLVNLILILGVTRIPVYARVVRAEVLEVRERVFVEAVRGLGGDPLRIVFKHIMPVVLPTVLAVATLDFAIVMLAESALSFLGIGIQPPEVTWGLMVAQGRNYLSTAWWLTFFPGFAIMLTTLAANVLSNWLHIATDPVQRWRLSLDTTPQEETDEKK